MTFDKRENSICKCDHGQVGEIATMINVDGGDERKEIKHKVVEFKEFVQNNNIRKKHLRIPTTSV